MSNKRILVIDDEEAVRRSFELALEDTDFDLTTVDSGFKGVEEVKKDYQVVFLDLKMPGMNGMETLKEIREYSLELPVYIMTAFHKEFLTELNEAKDKGLSFQLLRKPIGSIELQTLIQSILNNPISFD